VEFFSIENIHAVREAFAQFRGLVSMADGRPVDESLTNKKLDWLKINLQVLNGAVRVQQLIESKSPVFIHCRYYYFPSLSLFFIRVTLASFQKVMDGTGPRRFLRWRS
jgi:hypothetical protein